MVHTHNDRVMMAKAILRAISGRMTPRRWVDLVTGIEGSFHAYTVG